MLKIVLMAIVGAVSGYFVPMLAQMLIDYKSKKKNKTYEEHFWYPELWCKLICVVLSAGGLGYCGYLNPSWILLILVGIIWIIGMVTILVDIRIRIIANEVILALLGLSIVFRIIYAGSASLLNSFLTMVVIMFVCILLGKLMGLWKVGAGDVKLFGIMGFLYGCPDIVYPLIAFVAVLSVFVIGGLKLYKITLKTMFAMAPFIVAGMLGGFFFILQ